MGREPSLTRSSLVAVLALAAAFASPTDENGSTALILATWDGHLEVVELLLEHGADADASYIGVLLEHPGIDVNQIDNHQMTALDNARGRRTKQLLQQAGARKRREL